MKKKLAFLSLILLVGLVGCKDEDTSSTPTNDYYHTSLVYMVADNSLNDYADEDIEEMVEGFNSIEDTANYHLLIYLDDSSTPRLLRVIKEDGVATTETLKRYSEQNSLNVDIMSSVINDALDMYPNDSYGLTLWSHGNGWLPGTDQSSSGRDQSRAFGVDDNNDIRNQDGGVQMDILDLRTALDACPHFDYILFDACQMQSIEVDYELRNNSDYLIASPISVSAYGAPYEDVVPAFFEKDDAANAIVEAYFKTYNEDYSYNPSGSGNDASDTIYTYGIALSVVDCSYLEDLATTTKTILTTYIADSATVSTSTVYSYDSNFYNELYDLDEFIQALTDNDANYTTWKTVFDKVVTTYYTTDYTYSDYADYADLSYGAMVSMDGTSGLSTYIPNNSDFANAVFYTDYLPDLAKKYPISYSYLTEEYIEEYSIALQEYYADYYKDFAWDTDAGWKSIGW